MRLLLCYCHLCTVCDWVGLSEAESNKLKCLCLLFKPTCHRILTTQFILNGSMSRNKVVNFYVSFVDLKKWMPD